MTCKQSDCPLRLKCAIANGQIKGKRTIYTGYTEGKCNEYKPIKKEVGK